jgi:hypothetical protein
MLALPQALFYLIDLQWDPSHAVMHAAGAALTLIIDAGGSWGQQVCSTDRSCRRIAGH